jgi:hypothetical protein
MKRVSPQYEPITDLLLEVYSEVQDMLASSNEGHKKISEIDAKVGTFRATIQQKVESVKQTIVNEVEKYFGKIKEDLRVKIDNMGYIQLLGQYKDQIKKVIMGLRNIEKCFNPDNDKIMRVVIKYKGGTVKKEVQEFENGLSQFLKHVSNNFVTFSVREDYRQVIADYLDAIKKIEVTDVGPLQPLGTLPSKLREVY